VWVTAGHCRWGQRAKGEGFGTAFVVLHAPHMASTTAYKNLDAWQQGMNLVEHCYKATINFPREEVYGLTSQRRRAAVSIPSNVAEGCCRRNTKVYANHVAISLGSHGELETCIELAFSSRIPPSE
jgi:four helix bundle protein